MGNASLKREVVQLSVPPHRIRADPHEEIVKGLGEFWGLGFKVLGFIVPLK